MVQAIQLLARDLATKDYKTRHSLKRMSPTEYRKFHKAEPSDQRASAHIHVGPDKPSALTMIALVSPNGKSNSYEAVANMRGMRRANDASG